MRAWTWMALIGVGCAGPLGATDPTGDTETPTLPGAEAALTLGLAGAPVELFGPASAPRFDSAFQTLTDAGFNSFFPLFVTLETPERSEYEDHLTHFLAPELLGSGDALTCKGNADPYAAAEGRLDIVFPGLVVLGLQDPTQPLDVDAFTAALQVQAESCWSDHPGVVSRFYTYDEPALFRVVNAYLGQPRLRAENVAAAADAVRASSDLKVWLVEGPGALGLNAAGLPASETDDLIAEFDADVAVFGPTADVFGFDVYPVPDFPLTAPGDYVRKAKLAAPNRRIHSVLQGMAFARISGGETPGRAPTPQETRFMAVDSIVAGADELYWYGVSSLRLDDPTDAALWADLIATASALSQVEDAIVGDRVLVDTGGEAEVRAHREGDGLVVFVSRRSDGPARVRLDLPESATEVESVLGATAEIVDGAVQIDLDGLDGAVFRVR